VGAKTESAPTKTFQRWTRPSAACSAAEGVYSASISSLFFLTISLSLQCFDAVGWVAKKLRCRLAYGSADVTATHCLLLQ